MYKAIQIIMFLLLAGCADASNKSGDTKQGSGYNLHKPACHAVLPEELHEVSGATVIGHEKLACVQDEEGLIFIYDLEKNKVLKSNKFYVNGDYEGVACVDTTLYVLRSEGALLEVSNYKSDSFKTTLHYTGIPTSNYEGLCYDADNNRLLIGSKSNVAKGPEYKNIRVIYAIDLVTKQNTGPAFTFKVDSLLSFAIKTKALKNADDPFKMRISAIAIHPVNKKLYLLSAADHLLFVFSSTGEIEYIEQLNENVFNKAEGITFLPNGDMIVTNEGQDKEPTIMRFTYIK